MPSDGPSLTLGELHDLRAQLAEDLAAVDAEIAERQAAETAIAEESAPAEDEARWPVAPTPGRVRGRGPRWEVHSPTCWSPSREAPRLTTAQARARLATAEYGLCPSCRPPQDGEVTL